MEKQIRAVAYARVSSREQAEKELSIPAQLDFIRKYCKQKGWKLVHEYIDAGKSAKTDDRPEFQQMVAMAKRSNRNFDVIVVHKFDRFSRNRDDHVIYKSLLKKLGVLVYSVTEQTDPETPYGFLIEGILEVISEFYNMNLRDEVFKGMKENARKGYRNGGIAPYGYRLSKITEPTGAVKTILIPGPDNEVATIKRMFHNYVYDNFGYKKIASDLNEESIPSFSGKPWSYSSVHDILHNEVYIGNTIWNMYDYSTGKKKKPKSEWIIHENTHAALVSKEDFDLVKAKSKSRIKNSSLFESTNTTFILRGLFKCPYCGSNMIGSQSGYKKGSKTVRKYYMCGNYQRKGKSTCKFKSFNKDKIESAVSRAIVKEFTFLSMDKVLEEEILRYTNDKNKDQSYQINNLSQEIQILRMRLDLTQKELELSQEKQKLRGYINDLNKEIQDKMSLKDHLGKESENSIISTEEIEIVRNKLKHFLAKFQLETPDIQNMLLKEYVDTITYNLINDTVGVHIIVKNSTNIIVVNKHLYASF